MIRFVERSGHPSLEEQGRYEAGRNSSRQARRSVRRSRLAYAGLGQEHDDGLLYAGRIIREPAMESPTVDVLTDRNRIGRLPD